MGSDPRRVASVPANRGNPLNRRASLEVENLVEVQAPGNDDASTRVRGESTGPVTRRADRQAGALQPGGGFDRTSVALLKCLYPWLLVG